MSGVRGWFRKFILRRKYGVVNLAPLKPEPWHKVLERARAALGEQHGHKLDAAIHAAVDAAAEGSEILLRMLMEQRDPEREEAVAVRVNEVLKGNPMAVDFWVLAAHVAAWCRSSPDPTVSLMAFHRTITGMMSLDMQEDETVN